MSKGLGVSSLTAIFGNSEEKSQDSEKLMDLYWNRAELKKEFARMREERFRLQDAVKRQEGATARLQQKLDYLEDLLIDPQTTHNVVVYYQLRGLALRCKSKLARFAEQLKQQREQKKHQSLLADWQGQLDDEARIINRQLLDKQSRVQQLEETLQSEQRKLTSMSGFVRLFRGRSVMRTIDAIAEQMETSIVEERLLLDELDALKNRQPPDHQGLEIPAKRSINLMIIAFAQQLYLYFERDSIAGMVKEASQKSVGAINYGSRYECEQLLEVIAASGEAMEKESDFADILRKRAKLLGERAQFSSENEAVPIAATVDSVIQFDEEMSVRELDVGILGENYWDVCKVLSR